MKLLRKLVLNLVLARRTIKLETNHFYAAFCFLVSIGSVAMMFEEGFTGIMIFGASFFFLGGFVLLFQDRLQELSERAKNEPKKTAGSGIKNPFDFIGNFEFGQRTYIFGFSWKFGMLLYIQAAALVHPILLLIVFWILDEPFEEPYSFFGLYSIVILAISLFVSCTAIGYRVVIGPRTFRLDYTFLFIPITGFSCALENVYVKEFVGSKELEYAEEKGRVIIHKDDDPWAEMGFEYWVAINHKGERHDIGDNGNCEVLYTKVRKAIEKHKLRKDITNARWYLV